jgi:lysophospholipase L1-like esterase
MNIIKKRVKYNRVLRILFQYKFVKEILIMIDFIRKKTRLISLTLFFIIVTMLSPNLVQATEISLPKSLNYVALGDSLAAGQTPFTDRLTTPRYLSYNYDKSYADFLADKLKEKGVLGSYFDGYCTSGYTTKDLLSLILYDIHLEDSKIKNADIITLDIGANDLLHYILADTLNLTTIDEEAQKSIKRIGLILSAIKLVNPKVKIYIMGYYNAFPYTPQIIQKKLVKVIESFNNGIKTVASIMSVTYIDTEATISKTLKVYVPNPRDIHLSVSGYEAVAGEFWNKMSADLFNTSETKHINLY